MKTFTLKTKKSLTSLIDESTKRYLVTLNGESRKQNGQFFTPANIAQFMAKLSIFNSDFISFLDPGAGTGILTAAMCDEIINRKNVNKLEIDLYENDLKVIPFLEKNVELIKNKLDNYGIQSRINLYKIDFIEKNANILQNTLFSDEPSLKYDIVISNPPYYKVTKNSYHARLMNKIVHGQPNIYTFFMALAAILLKENGQLIFITPRSYCSGLYFKIFRKWFLEQITPIYFHSFESRTETFKNEVLQETIILKGINQKREHSKIQFSRSFNSNFNDLEEFSTNIDNIICSDDKDKIIHIPANENDIYILKIVKSWRNKFCDLGFRLSTGPVVSFRTTQHISEATNYDGLSTAPLIWMNHLSDFKIKFPIKKFKKPQTIKITKESLKLLLKNKNYVLVKRFTSKEQKKRVTAYFYSANDFQTTFVGFENHLNYIWKPKGELSEKEAWGILAILNSSLIDKYFRIINGNTQVNAFEINNLPFPDYEKIVNIGKMIIDKPNISYSIIDWVVYTELGLKDKIEETYN